MFIIVVLALLELSFLVLIHELGHFLAAKQMGIWVEEFGIGLPPKIWSKKVGETEYSLNALPIGGFVRLHGETRDGTLAHPDRAYVNKGSLAKIYIALAGVIVNFVFAVLVFVILNWLTGVSIGVRVSEVSPDSPAAEIQITKGDVITKLNKEPIVLTETFSTLIARNRGKIITLELQREVDGSVETVIKEVTIREERPKDQGLLGVSYGPQELILPGQLSRIPAYFYYGGVRTQGFIEEILLSFETLFVSLIHGKLPAGVAGPLGVVAFTSEITKQAIEYRVIYPILEFLGIISINLAILNLVPFPPLDGSRVLFVTIEKLFGRKILPRVEYGIQVAGMALVLLFMLSITISEAPRLLKAGSLAKFIESYLEMQ